MSKKKALSSTNENNSNLHEEMELRRGPWTLEEDALLLHYIDCHGEGRWNSLARCSGLKRTGKSCRLRWLNYLKPDVKRGNLSPEEQFLILELHSKWGNRWSRIAQYLPGRTDNEIKNYWRTRVLKQARQLKIDANSVMFRDAVRSYWLPRLLENMNASAYNYNHDYMKSINHVNHPTNHHIHQQLNHPANHDHQEFHNPNIQDQVHEKYRSFPGSSTVAVHDQLSSYPRDYMISPNLTNDLNCITFNQINCSYEVEKPYSIDNNSVIIPPLSESKHSHSLLSDCTPATDYGDSNCMNSIVGDNLWNMDDLYGMLQSYINVGVESGSEDHIFYI